jgi:hypothetical protein
VEDFPLDLIPPSFSMLIYLCAFSLQQLRDVVSPHRHDDGDDDDRHHHQNMR